MFEEVEAKTKILITLSDGKPEDYDGYRGEYGIEDTRIALLESRQQGIHPFCITIDKEGRDYLKTMYGKASYIVIDDVKQLPLKVADIYRNITSWNLDQVKLYSSNRIYWTKHAHFMCQ